MRIYILTILSILSISLIWVLVQHFARLYSAKHPELGPHREEGSSCCGGCIGRCHRQEQE